MKLNRNKKWITLLIMGGVVTTILIVWMLPPQGNGNDKEQNPFAYLFTNLDVHAPIQIYGNTELDTLCAASGRDGLSWETAYILENFLINSTTGNDRGYTIELQQVDRYLIIQNCCLIGAFWTAGISLKDCSNINISGCGFFENMEGIEIENSSSITVKDCKFWGNPVYDVHLLGLRASQILGNEMIGNGLCVSFYQGWGNVTIDPANIVNGKPILYYEGLQNLHPLGISAASVILFNCSDAMISNFTFSGKYSGIQLGNCTNANIFGNQIKDAVEGTITLYATQNCTVFNNLFQNATGISLVSSNNNTIRNNEVYFMDYQAIFVGGSINTYIENNRINAISDYAIKYGIGMRLDNNENITIRNNTLNRYIWVTDCNNTMADTTNLIRGRPLLYREGNSTLMIDGSPYGQVHLINCSDMEVRLAQGWVTCAFCNNITIRNCTFRESERVWLSESPNCRLQENFFANATCFVYNSPGTKFTKNAISVGGVDFWSSSNVVIQQNVIDQAVEGIQLLSCSSCVIEGNSITRCSEWAIYLSNSGGTTITGNYFCGNYQNIIQSDSGGCTISGNVEDEVCAPDDQNPNPLEIPGFPIIYMPVICLLGTIFVIGQKWKKI